MQRRLTEKRDNEVVIDRSSRMARHWSCRHTDRTLADRRIARMGIIKYRENSKYSTPLQVRRITKALEGQRCASKEEIIRRWKNMEQIYQKKEAFVTRVKLALIADERSNIADITYQRNEQGLEIIMVLFKLGGFRRINVTGNSNGANFMEIGRAVYEGGARGEIYR